MPDSLRIAALTLFPVKGLRGIDVPQARITPFGLEGDRRWMIVGPEGRFRSQREVPALTHVGVSSEDQDWVLEHPIAGVLRIPRAGVPEGAPAQVIIWDDTVRARHAGAQAEAWLRAAFGEDLSLVWMPDDTIRPADPAWAGEGHRVSFADGFPLLVLGTASVAELNTRLATPIPANRFRANVLVEGGEPWAEDGWHTLIAPEATLRLVKPCARCVVITTDQQTGERSKEPTATLATYRRQEGKVMVGMNALAGPDGAILRVGDALRIK